MGQLGTRFKVVRNYNFEQDSRLAPLQPGLSAGRASYHSLFFTIRLDTRDSFINASRGIVIQAEFETAPKSDLVEVAFSRQAMRLQHYAVLFYPKTVIASRFSLENLSGIKIPVQFLIPIGGNQTLRGYPQDRFLDRTAAHANLELRYPIIWRFGGVLGYDTGKVWSNLPQVGLHDWASNFTAGLRFYMKTFVVRLDVGFSDETTGFYLNFGHIF